MLEDLSKLINEGIDSVFAEYPIIVWQLLATLVLVIFVAAFFWGPITKFIEKEEQETKAKLEAAIKKEQDAQVLFQSAENHYNEVKDSLSKLEKSLIVEANEKADAIVNSAKKQAEQRLNDVKVEIASEIIASEEKIKEAIKDVAILASEKIVKANLNQTNSSKIVDEIIEGLSDGEFK